MEGRITHQGCKNMKESLDPHTVAQTDEQIRHFPKNEI